jgi:hypothetical protein
MPLAALQDAPYLFFRIRQCHGKRQRSQGCQSVALIGAQCLGLVNQAIWRKDFTQFFQERSFHRCRLRGFIM